MGECDCGGITGIYHIYGDCGFDYCYCEAGQLAEKMATGLIEKYRVERTDGKPLKDGCVVLEWGDPSARYGIAAFANIVGVRGYHKLKKDLVAKLDSYEDPMLRAIFEKPEVTIQTLRAENDILRERVAELEDK